MISDEEFLSWIKNPNKIFQIKAEDLAALMVYSQFSEDFDVGQSPSINHNIDSVWKIYSKHLFTDKFIGLKEMKNQ